jgi:hypothetical protein
MKNENEAQLAVCSVDFCLGLLFGSIDAGDMIL